MLSTASKTTDCGQTYVKTMSLEMTRTLKAMNFEHIDSQYDTYLFITALQALNNPEMPLCHADTLADKRQTHKIPTSIQAEALK